jgi:hypothetical protein
MINGLTLKGIKHFEGREGYGLNATLAAAGAKKVFAKVIDDASGGEMDIYWEGKTKLDMDKNKVMVETLAMSYFVKHKRAGLSNPHRDLAVDLVNELDRLADIEKSFKKNVKKGFPVTLLLEYMDRDCSDEEFLKNYTEDQIVGVRGWNDKVKAMVDQKFDHPKYVTVFQKPEDFDFND